MSRPHLDMDDLIGVPMDRGLHHGSSLVMPHMLDQPGPPLHSGLVHPQPVPSHDGMMMQEASYHQHHLQSHAPASHTLLQQHMMAGVPPLPPPATMDPESLAMVVPRRGRRGRKGQPQEFKCATCSKVFTREGHLRVHERVHTGEKPFTCSECNKSFSDKPTLKRHLRVHSGEKPYKCPHCHKSFNQSGNLKTHKRIHSGEKPYKCEICGKGYTALGSLRAHKRSHTGEKPYKCTTCEKTFGQLGHLKTHERIHTGEKPFMCTLCNKQFRVSFALKSHYRTHMCDPKTMMTPQGILNANQLPLSPKYPVAAPIVTPTPQGLVLPPSTHPLVAQSEQHQPLLPAQEVASTVAQSLQHSAQMMPNVMPLSLPIPLPGQMVVPQSMYSIAGSVLMDNLAHEIDIAASQQQEYYNNLMYQQQLAGQMPPDL